MSVSGLLNLTEDNHFTLQRRREQIKSGGGTNSDLKCRKQIFRPPTFYLRPPFWGFWPSFLCKTKFVTSDHTGKRSK